MALSSKYDYILCKVRKTWTYAEMYLINYNQKKYFNWVGDKAEKHASVIHTENILNFI